MKLGVTSGEAFFALQEIVNLSFRDVFCKLRSMETSGSVEVPRSCFPRLVVAVGDPGRLNTCMELCSSSSHQPIP